MKIELSTEEMSLAVLEYLRRRGIPACEVTFEARPVTMRLFQPHTYQFVAVVTGKPPELTATSEKRS